ncbi:MULTISPECIES: hypothetical protein [Idiomarina]|uniref:Uncharacterized protein n=1 Tax=Idiomarina loihiensis (strain ATCC BAA-735 / DSM 15497 / L2-TR) TaxID=283942 RepID=Q5QZH7_IDILO|nr:MULTISPECIES: hypothetical protein [Idiomarina]AAV83446.1 Hypothetical protein IL2614 [Idiomarina loihiensis L2TR]AGM37490.1 hypothetical protein K734_13155 [Idiomarina loihiensis GSL 199]MBF39420.1 hypothetical protein [Idiomarinaceae bacterium]|tara:strand:- start:5380 stop:5907 length:528 start_codon:yes stop_codon:yes gene_type:complete
MSENDSTNENSRQAFRVYKSQDKNIVGSNIPKELDTHLETPRIVFVRDKHVNSSWQKVLPTAKNDITAKLIGLQHYPENYLSYDIDLLTSLDRSSTVNGSVITAAGQTGSINTPFILHDHDTQYHVAAFVSSEGLCHVLSVWPFDVSDNNGQVHNRKPESVMSKVESLYEALVLA